MNDWESENKHLLLTGSPGCGKSTILLHVADRIGDKKVRGFTTEEVREKGNRVGFRIRTFSGEEGLLSHVRIKSPYRVGKYGVDVEEFERLVLPELAQDDDQTEAYLIDEIGKMECFSEAFVEAVRKLLRGKVPVAATVAAKGGGFIGEAKKLPNLNLVHVTKDNRDTLPKRIVEWLRRGM